MYFDVCDGYFRAKASEPAKLRVLKDDNTVTYNIGIDFENFPFQFGTGEYDIRLYKNVTGSKYALIDRQVVNADFNEFAPFLHSNQYVRSDLACLDDICVSDVKEHVSHSYVYDYVKALLVQEGALPDIEHCCKYHMGICQDLSALAAALYRRMNVPAKLVIGYVGVQNHAWVEYFDNGWIIYDPTADILHKIYKQSDYKKIRWY